MSHDPPIGERLLSIADISRHFSLPESTTRYYCKRFAAFIPGVGEGRRRRYRPETLEVISAVLEQMQKSRTAIAVEDALQARFPRNALAISKADRHPATRMSPEQSAPAFLPASALHLLERQTMALESISQVIRLVAERFSAPPAESADSLRRDMDTLRLLLHASEKTQQADLDQLRRWMTRVIQTRSVVDKADTAQVDAAQAV
jgi:DNA-binding transcriptional MerR regulator